MTYPSDNQFQDVTISAARPSGDGWEITRTDGWTLFAPKYEGEPKAGSAMRVYGRGIGHRFRGLYIDGVKVFYRTEAEDNEKADTDLYGADATEWLKRWDEGRSVWSIEMGGLGPGYEQCIQIVAAETLRFLLQANPHPQDLIDNWKDKWRDAVEKDSFANEKLTKLGLSGAQHGAGVSLATKLYIDGPRKIMRTPEVEDRKIQVSRAFPSV